VTETLRIVHAGLDGAPEPPALEALARAGFTDVIGLPGPGADVVLAAMALAKAATADIVIATDPVRCVAAIPDPRRGWRRLSADELGVALGEDLATTGLGGGMASTVMCSRELGVIAAEHGLPYTLTPRAPWGEDGLGYAYDETGRYRCGNFDLDGPAAAVAVARLVARLTGRRWGVTGLLDDLARRHGLYATSRIAYPTSDGAPIMAALRARPPDELAGSPVARVAGLGEALELETARHDRLVVLPAGGGLECYLEVIRPVEPKAGFDDLTEAHTAANTRLVRLTAELPAILE